MDHIRIKAAAQKIRGSVEKSVGKLTGNKKLEAKGHSNHAAGSIRMAAGTAKDSVKEALKNQTKGD